MNCTNARVRAASCASRVSCAVISVLGDVPTDTGPLRLIDRDPSQSRRRGGSPST